VLATTMRYSSAALVLLSSTAVVNALPRRVQEEKFSPTGPVRAPDGVPECEMQDGPFGRSENMADVYQGVGTCDILISSGQYTCAANFCPDCNQNMYCDKTCGFCESTVDEVVDCDVAYDPSCAEETPDCQNDEAARAAADPFQNPLSPFTQGCDEIATNNFCEVQSYIALGVTTFCCASCQARADERAGGHECDFMAIVNSCQHPETMSDSADIATLCAQPCSVAVVANYAACMKDPGSDMAPYAASLEPIVEACSQLAGTAVNVFSDVDPGAFCFSGQVHGCFRTGHPEMDDNIVSCQDVLDHGICAGVDIISESAEAWTLPDNFAAICPIECGTDQPPPPGSGH
jgi:hypothetical protein